MKVVSSLSSVKDVLLDVKLGRPFIIVDGQDRENEGDLVVVAEKVTPNVINTMIRYGTGIVCLAVSRSIIEKLSLSLMPKVNVDENYTAFAMSIDARYGISTGVSTYDRVATILVAIDDKSTINDIVSPGHVFPVVANDRGLLVRQGHTEASVAMAELAGFKPAAVICELMNDDGSMSRMVDLEAFACARGLKIVTIESIVEYMSSVGGD